MSGPKTPDPLTQANKIISNEMARLWSYARKLHALEVTYAVVPVWGSLTEAGRLEYLQRAARLPSDTPSE